MNTRGRKDRSINEFDKIFKSEKCRTLRIDSSTSDLREADIEAYSPVETNNDPVVILKQLVKKSFEIITKKPILPSDDEIKINYKARSAKLRIAKRTKFSPIFKHEAAA